METIDFPEYFEEYKSGFSTGLIDFIINPEIADIDIRSILIDDEDPNIWQIGYCDAIAYYKLEAYDKGNNPIELSNIFAIICELYTMRIGQVNKKYGVEIPAFTLIKIPGKEI